MIKFYCTEKLHKTLELNNIESYAPAYGGESAGLDLYNCGPDITIKPIEGFLYSEKVLISTGLHLLVPKGSVAFIKERGSIVKTPLKLRAGVIDSGYTGEIFVNAVNVSNESYTIKENQKLPFQIVVVKCDNHFEEIVKEEYLNLSDSSKRKSGKVGSSD